MGPVNDKLFDMDESGGPKIKACLLHPHMKAVKEFTHEKYLAKYGLCKTCVNKFASLTILMKRIETEIRNRVTNLRGKI